MSLEPIEVHEHPSGEIPILMPPPEAIIETRKGLVVTWPIITVAVIAFVSGMLALAAMYLAFTSQKDLADSERIKSIQLQSTLDDLKLEQRCRADYAVNTAEKNAILQSTIADVIGVALDPQKVPGELRSFRSQLTSEATALRTAVEAQAAAITACAPSKVEENP